jgi:hypothetical protein
MSYKISTFDPAERARQKQASRDEDARRLAAGEVTKAQLKRENGMLSGMDFSNSSIVAIGGKKLAKPIPIGRQRQK